MTRLAVLLLLGAVAPASAQTAKPETPEIATSGQGEVVLASDHVRLRLGVEARASTAAGASSQVGARVLLARRAIQAIYAKGLPLDSIRVTNFDVSPNYQYERERRLIDYGGRATIELTVRPPDRMGAVIDTALVSGVSAVQSMEFASDSVPAARNRAIAMAVDKARRDAEALARAAGGRLGRVLGISTSGDAQPMYKARAMEMSVAGAPQVERDVIVSVAVQARWEFVPGSP